MKVIKRIISRFAIILTCVCVAVPLFEFVINGSLDNGDFLLLEVTIVSFLSAMGEVLIVNANIFDESSMKMIRLRMLVYYIYINICVIGFGCVVGWFDIKKPLEIIFVAVLILAIFVVNCVVTYTWDRSESNKINERLEQMRNNSADDKD